MNMLRKLMMVLAVFLLVCPFTLLGQTAVREHLVQRGENLTDVAKLYGVSEEEIKQQNPLIEKMGGLMVGMKIKIPERKAGKADDSSTLLEQADDAKESAQTEKNDGMSVATEVPKMQENQPQKVSEIKNIEYRANYITDDGMWGLGFTAFGGFIGLGVDYMFGTSDIYSSSTYTFHLDLSYPFWFEEKRIFYIRPTIGLGYGCYEATAKRNSYASDISTKGVMLNFHPEAGVRLIPNIGKKKGSVYLTVGWFYASIKKIQFKPKYGAFTVGLAYIY